LSKELHKIQHKEPRSATKKYKKLTRNELEFL